MNNKDMLSAHDAEDKPNLQTMPDKRPALTPQAKRALQEAEARRAELDAKTKSLPKELGGRGGLDPARYGDWEVKGISSDF